ncbi:MAG: alginate O-acetyltransferase [Pseudomonas sp.]|uniref:alginate O-acetyltransferase n=1 Tax=Pseudomonas sp. TaxID=306 RepID=UPI0033945910
MRARTPFRLGALSAALLAATLAPTGLAFAEPHYSAQVIGPLCPKATDVRQYNTPYLNFFSSLVQAQDDWLFRTRYDLRTDFGTTAAGYAQFKQLSQALKRKGIELLVVYQPTRGLVHPDKLIGAERASFDYELAKRNYLDTVEQLRKTGVWVTDLSPLFAEHEQRAYFFKGDNHWTPTGANRTAALVAETLKQMPGFETIPKQEFVSKRVGLFPKEGALHKVAGQFCNTSYATEHVDRYETEPVGESTSDDALFGEEKTTEVTVVGTSNSGPAYNFVGFLQEYSGVEMLNLAVSGGGFDSSILQYMSSKDFHDKPPKILIWEFAPHYDLAQKSFYRQAVPLADNGCDGRPAVLKNKIKLRPGSNEVLINAHPDKQQLRGGDYQVDLTFSDPSVHAAQATLWYLNGRREQYKLEQSERVDTGGRYVFELRNDPDWRDLNLLAMEIQGATDMPENLSVEATLCKRPDGNRLTAQSE